MFVLTKFPGKTIFYFIQCLGVTSFIENNVKNAPFTRHDIRRVSRDWADGLEMKCIILESFHTRSARCYGARVRRKRHFVEMHRNEYGMSLEYM